jgi:hypothetical protein
MYDHVPPGVERGDNQRGHSCLCLNFLKFRPLCVWTHKTIILRRLMTKYYYSRFIALLLLTDNVLSWIECTPSPVLTEILLWTCGSYFEWDGEHLELDHRHMPRVATYAGCTFLDTRTRLQLVCCEWHALVTGCGDFWSSYMVKPLESRDKFHEWTRHMTAVPSHIAIALPPVRVPASACLDPVLVEDIISLLRGQAPNCATLVIASPDTPSLPALSEGL